jgi:hypothetical protein
MNSRRRRLATILVAMSIGLFALSLASDCYYIDGADPRAWSPGWGLLLVGWLGIGSGGTAWLANPALITGWITFFCRKTVVSLFCSLVALLLMISFLSVDTVIRSEAPTYARVIGYGSGYWLWLTSAGALLAGAVVRACPATPKSTTNASDT